MVKPVVFVIGASGNVGFATLQTLSSLTCSNQLEIRAGVRDLAKAEKVMALQGVAVVKATQGDEELVKTFSGVTVVFIVTPPTENRAELVIKTAEAAKEAGVQHLLVVSVPTDGGISDTVIGKQFCAIEEAISKLGVPYTFLRLPMFFDVYFLFKETIQKMSTMIMPSDPTKPIAAVAVVDAGKAAAAILADHSKHANKVYTIVSNCHTFSDAAKEFSKALGKGVSITTSTYDSTKRSLSEMGMQPWRIPAIIEFYKAIDDGLVFNQTTSHYKDITGEDSTSLKDWVDTVAPAFK